MMPLSTYDSLLTVYNPVYIYSNPSLAVSVING